MRSSLACFAHPTMFLFFHSMGFEEADIVGLVFYIQDTEPNKLFILSAA